jgi:tetratricopeptide (TPR) repeat protein
VLSESGEPQRAVSLVLDSSDPEPGMISLLLERLEAMARECPDDVMVQSSLARVLLFVGRAAPALEAVERAVAGSTWTAAGTVYLVHGDALEAMKRRSEAVHSWQQAVLLEPALAEPAVSRLQRIHEADPDDPDVQLTLGRLLADSGSMEQGAGLLVDLATRCPDRARRAFAQVEAVAKSHETDYQPALAAARVLSTTGELAPCAGWAARALQRGAPNAMVDQFLADLIEEHPGQPDLLRCQALARLPHQPEDACRLLAESAQGGSQQAERALEVLQRVATLHPGLAMPGLVACRIHLGLGNPQVAFQDLKTSIEKGQPCDEALELLARIQDVVPGEPQVHLAMAHFLQLRARGSDALASVQHAVDAGAGAESLDPLLQDLVAAKVPGALLERARIHLRRTNLPQALADLEHAVEQGLRPHVLETLSDLLREHPDELEARRLQLQLLRESGDLEAVLQCLKQALQAQPDDAVRLDWLLRRAEVRREAGDDAGASEDLEQARLLAADPDEFLEQVHQRRSCRLERQLSDAVGAERVRLLLELGRWDEAGQQLAAERRDEPGLRELRASLLLARGEAAAGLRVLRPGMAHRRLVDAAQRCDRPEVALAGLDSLLEECEDAGLHNARRRVLQQIWQRDLDPGSRALVARIPFEPKTTKP